MKTNDDALQVGLDDWLSVLDDSNYYEVLGVLDIADETAIKAAFHQFALSFHPDQHSEISPEQDAQIRLIFKRGAEAYRVLMDPGLRAKYDLALAQGHLRLDSGEIPAGAPLGASSIRTLEDLCSSASAKLSAARADQFLSAGDLESAKRELKLALYHDGNQNPELEERIDAIDLAMFAMGD